MPFDSLTLQQIQQTKAAYDTAQYQVAKDFADGSHWGPGGAYYIGNRPPTDAPDYAQRMQQLEAAFISKNAVGEVLHTHLNGIVGREPAWDYVVRRALRSGQAPTPDEQAALGLLGALSTAWWDARKPRRAMRQALATALLCSYGPLRLYVPPGVARNAQGNIEARSLVDAYSLLRLHAPDPQACFLLTDPDTEEQAGVFLYRQANEFRAEVCFLLPDGRTIIRILGPNGQVQESDPLDLGGRLPIYLLERDRLITPHVIQQQKALNLAETKSARNINQAGDRERLFVNVEPPTRADGTPAPYRSGAGVANFLFGAGVEDASGNIVERLDPSVTVFDPVDPEYVIKTSRFHYANILDMCGQTHKLIAGDATASGKSREQARAEFEATLEMSKVAVDDALRWLLETSAAYAAQFAGQPGIFAAYRVNANAHIDSGPLSPEERRENRADVEAKLMARERAMGVNGIDDPDGEQQKIAQETQAIQPVSARS